jgi:cytochrome c biogenesis factor
LDLTLKFSASWSGSGGFIVWWLTVFTLLVFLRRLKVKKVNVYHNITILSLFVVAFLNSAFDSINATNGVGLNPLLKSFWMLLHPPASFIGYALGLFVALDVFVGRENRFTMGLTWFFVTLANVLGGVWSYFTLGWGGYWAWDPVETGLLLPWLCLTAYFHTTNLRRGLTALTGFSVAFAGFVTRGGISPLHGFAVNPSGLAIIVLGIPFLLKAISEFKSSLKPNFDLKRIKPMDVAVYSLLGSYAVCLLGLIYQLISAIFGSRVDVSVDYYNFANMPFLIAFLSVLPVCGRDIRNYTRFLFLVYGVSVTLTVLTALRFIVWCESAPIYVNCAVSFVIPIAVFSFLSILGLRKLELKVLHISIPLLVIAVSVSWPYAYYEKGDSILITGLNEVKGDGLKVKVESVDFYTPKSFVDYNGLDITEECVERVKLKIGETKAVGEIELFNARFLTYAECLYTCRMLTGHGHHSICLRNCMGYNPIVVKPIVINRLFDNHYVEVYDEKTSRKSCYLPYYLYIQSLKSILSCDVNESKFLAFMSFLSGVDADELSKTVSTWNGDVKDVRFIITYKEIPLVNLLWISCVLMMLGEILSLARWRR